MPLFGKKEKKLDLPEVVDFSNDTWSYKGNPPSYKENSDGFTYDIVDADGNDKNAITLGLAGMLVIVLNAKSPKIKEDDIIPPLGKVVKTRNWHTMSVKEANFLIQTAIKKLTNSATSGDVFDLASYAPLEVKRVLLKTLFTISRMKLPAECREEAEHRIIDDIVPDIFANPDYELALLTGLIVKTDEKAAASSSKIETSPIIEPGMSFTNYKEDQSVTIPEPPSIPEPEPDSAFAELQKIYGRRVDQPAVRSAERQAAGANADSTSHEQAAAPAPVIEPVSGNSKSYNPFTVGEPASMNQIPAQNINTPQPNNPFASPEPVSNSQSPFAGVNTPQPNNPFASAEPVSNSKPPFSNFNTPQPNNPFASPEPVSNSKPPFSNFNTPQPNNPFASPEPANIPQPASPNFGTPQPNNVSGSFYQNAQRIPQAPVPNYGMQMPNSPYANQMNPQMQNYGYQQNSNPVMGNYQQTYQGQMWQQGQQGQQNQNTPYNYQMQNPPMQWQPYSQAYPQNQQAGNYNAQGYPNPQNTTGNNPGNNSQVPQQNSQNNQ